jgi:SAM-dependent methyltransferase
MSDPSPGLDPVRCPICEEATEFSSVRSARVDEFIRGMGIPQTRSAWAVCHGCGLVLQNPRPNDVAQEKLYTGGGYHGITDAEIAVRLRYMREKFEAKVAHVVRHAPGGAEVLDIGCGIGEVIALLKDRGIVAVGVQPDPSMAEVGRRTLGVEIRQGYFDESMFPDESFSVVFSNHVFEHLGDPLRVVRAIARALEPGGRCVTYVPTYVNNGSLGARAWMNSAHNWLFSHQTLEALFLRAGLTPVDHGYHRRDNELWLVVERPRAGLVERSPAEATRGLPPWTEVKRYHDVVLDARAALFAPVRAAERAAEVGRLAVRSPGELLAQAQRSVEYRVRAARLLWAGLSGR